LLVMLLTLHNTAPALPYNSENKSAARELT
jgi:hypothetical protein